MMTRWYLIHPLNGERVGGRKEKTDLSEIAVKQAAEIVPLPAHPFSERGVESLRLCSQQQGHLLTLQVSYLIYH